MAERCDHKFVDTNYCLKCGALAAELSGDQRSSRTAAPRAEQLGAGAEMWRTTLERALKASRRRNIEARTLIRVLQQYASEDHLRERIRVWLDGDAEPEELDESDFEAALVELERRGLVARVEQIGGAPLSAGAGRRR
jgi:hypothetical protein